MKKETIEYIKSQWREILNNITLPAKKEVNGEKSYICPLCGHGKNGDGLTFNKLSHGNNSLKCFSCGFSGDIIELYMQLYNTDFVYTIQKLAEMCNIYDDTKGNLQPYYNKSTTKTEAIEEDYTQFFLEANKNIKNTDYHRGISLDTLNRFKIGYIEDWKHPKALNAPASPRLIIPTSKNSYLARDTREHIPDTQKRYSKSKVGKTHLFNSSALKNTVKPIIIVEGELDALSIIDVGGEAVGLGSIGNQEKLIEKIKENIPAQPLIIAMDNDDPGNKASESLKERLDSIGVTSYIYNPFSPYKDANEALMKDRKAFEYAIKGTNDIKEIMSEKEKENLELESAAYSLKSFIDDIRKSKDAEYYQTGFESLDQILDGGLYAGLYVIGAISSLGKTTFCIQIADTIARQGHDVLIFSLEMARNELMAKSISRLTLLTDLEDYKTTKHAKTTRGILTGSRYKYYNAEEENIIKKAMSIYEKYGRHIYITEGVGDVGINVIKNKIERHMKITGKAPVVFIDYLQIIAPYDIRATDKQNTDKAVLELKRLSRDFNIPVIGISSFNRDNYMAPVNLASFKESGAIEYSSDVLIGLQYDEMDYREGESEKERQKRIRGLIKDMTTAARDGRAQDIQVKILKNRNGSKGSTRLEFYPMFNYFKEKPEEKNLEWI